MQLTSIGCRQCYTGIFRKRNAVGCLLCALESKNPPAKIGWSIGNRNVAWHVQKRTERYWSM